MAGTSFIPQGLGWQRDLPDNRDLLWDSDSVKGLLKRLKKPEGPLPESVDLRCDADGNYLLHAEDQGCHNNSCTHACLGLVEYFNRRCCGLAYRGSALFVYEMTRRLNRTVANGDVGIRATFKTLKRFGAPPHWMCNDTTPDQNPLNDISLLGYSKDLEDLIYFRIWSMHSKRGALSRLRAFLAAGFPVVFGFPVPINIRADDPVVMCRPEYDSYFGGQAVLAIGYDDHRLSKKKGAVLVRSSWGSQWGEEGYGWLPYDFVDKHLAADFWTALRPDWKTGLSNVTQSLGRHDG